MINIGGNGEKMISKREGGKMVIRKRGWKDGDKEERAERW